MTDRNDPGAEPQGLYKMSRATAESLTCPACGMHRSIKILSNAAIAETSYGEIYTLSRFIADLDEPDFDEDSFACNSATALSFDEEGINEYDRYFTRRIIVAAKCTSCHRNLLIEIHQETDEWEISQRANDYEENYSYHYTKKEYVQLLLWRSQSINVLIAPDEKCYPRWPEDRWVRQEFLRFLGSTPNHGIARGLRIRFIPFNREIGGMNGPPVLAFVRSMGGDRAALSREPTGCAAC